MVDVTTALDNARVVLAVATLTCYLVAPWEKFKDVKTPDRNTNTLFILFALLVSAIPADITLSFWLPNIAGDDIPLATAIHSFGIIIQLDGLWKPKEQPPWYDLVLSWGLMVVFDLLSHAKYFLMVIPSPITPAIVCGLATSSYRICLLIGLIAWFVWTGVRGRERYTALSGDDPDAKTVSKTNNTDREEQSTLTGGDQAEDANDTDDASSEEHGALTGNNLDTHDVNDVNDDSDSDDDALSVGRLFRPPRAGLVGGADVLARHEHL